MNKRLRFHLDEHLPHAIATALQRRGVDITTTPEAGLRQTDDLAQLEFVNREKRTLVTQDSDFLRYHAQGVQHAGIAYCKKDSRTIGQIVEALYLMYEVMTPEEMKNKIEYL